MYFVPKISIFKIIHPTKHRNRQIHIHAIVKRALHLCKRLSGFYCISVGRAFQNNSRFSHTLFNAFHNNNFFLQLTA